LWGWGELEAAEETTAAMYWVLESCQQPTEQDQMHTHSKKETLASTVCTESGIDSAERNSTTILYSTDGIATVQKEIALLYYTLQMELLQCRKK
jgi:hypothetical protein